MIIDNSLPRIDNNITIGLFGGSFNPPHEGHLLVAEEALKQLSLDYVWWMISPGNPLKRYDNLASVAKRVALSNKLVKNKRIIVTDLESKLNFQYSVDTVAYLEKRYPNVRFVWIMGADSLIYFHKWHNWEKLVNLIPLVVINRPKVTFKALNSPVAQKLSLNRVPASKASTLPFLRPPAWSFLFSKLSFLSSTQLREK